MSLYRNPLDDILENIKALNPGVVLPVSDYLFSNPVVITPDASGNNTQLVVSEKSINSAYQGSVTVSYKRLDLATLLTLIPGTIRGYGITSTAQFIAKLNSRYGLLLTTADVADTPIVVDGEGNAEVVLQAVQNSLGWVGSVTFQLVKGDLPLPSLLTQKTLPGLPYPNADVRKPYGEMYSYWRDCSNRALDLAAVETLEGTDIAALAALVKLITGDDWKATGQSRYSLSGASVTYNGTTEGNNMLKPFFERGLVIVLGEDCLGLSGTLYLHYNMPDGFD